MRLKHKSARRLLLAALVAVLGVASLVSIFVVRRWQSQRYMETLRAEGMAAFKASQFPQTIDKLGPYLRRNGKDREAWLMFATARESVEEGNDGHNVQAMGAYKRALELGEKDPAVALKLAKCYNAVGYSSEARDLVLRYRPADLADAQPEHADLLMEELRARLVAKTPDPQIGPLSERLVQLEPNRHRAVGGRIAALARLGESAAAVEFARGLTTAQPDDPYARFVAVLAESIASGKPDPVILRTAACRLAGLDEARGTRLHAAAYDQTDLAAQLVTIFDSLQLREHSLAVLADAADRLNHADSLRLLARRLWQAGGFERLITMVRAKGDLARLHSDVLVFTVLSLREVRRLDDAKPIVATLDGRTRDFHALAWSPSLNGLLSGAPAQAILKAVDAALKLHPREPVLTFLRGEALLALGRADEARSAWRGLYDSTLAFGWALPLLRTSETLAEEGRLEEAARAASEAQSIGGPTLASAYALLRAQCLLAEQGRPMGDPGFAIDRLDLAIREIEKVQRPDVVRAMVEQLLPGRVSLLVAAGRRAEALGEVQRILVLDPAVSPDVARRLAAVSARTTLGVEQDCLAIAERSGASPQTTLTRALLMDAQGLRAEASALFDRAIAAASSDKPRWLLARAQFLDLIEDPSAKDAFAKVCTEFPDVLYLHIAAIRAASVVRDAALVQKLADRLVALGASDPDRPSVDVRLARARALLAGAPTVQKRDEAAAALRGLLADVPDLLDVRRRLIETLLLDDASKGIRPDVPGAIEQLRAAAAVAPDRSQFSLQLARLLIGQGNRREASEELLRLALDERVSLVGRLAAVDQLIDQRELQNAATSLDAILQRAGPEPETDILLRRASILTRLRRDREATETYRRLADRGFENPDALVTLALAVRPLGDRDIEALFTSQLDNPRYLPWRVAMSKARLADADGRPDVALAAYARAVELGSDNLEPWVRAARYAISINRLSEAVDFTTRARGKFPENADLAVLAEQASLASAKPQEGQSLDLGRLADAYDRAPSTQPIARVLRELDKAQRAGQLADPARVVALTKDFPDQPGVHALCARLLLGMGPTGLKPACDVLAAAAARFPANVEIAKLTAGALSAAGQWDVALRAAEAWREVERSPDADLATAEAALMMARPRQAAELIRGITLPLMVAESDMNALRVLRIRAQAAAMQGDATGAWTLLQAHLGSGRVRQGIVLPLAAGVVADLPVARRWLHELTTRATGKGSEPERLSIARGWLGLAQRFPAHSPDLAREAVALLTTLNEAKPSPEVTLTLAQAHEVAGQSDQARATLVQGIEATPSDVDFLCALSALHLRRSESGEAVRRAQAAADASPESFRALAALVEAAVAAGKAVEATDAAGAARHLGSANSAFERLRAIPRLDVSARFLVAGLADQLDRHADALAEYQVVLEQAVPASGIDSGIVRNNMAYLLFRSGAQGEALRRARTLAQEAVSTHPNLGPLLDTLGAIEAASGDAPAAIATFRRAVAADPKAIDPLISLADLLAPATETRDEARELLKKVDAALAEGVKPSATRAKTLERARQSASAQ